MGQRITTCFGCPSLRRDTVHRVIDIPSQATFQHKSDKVYMKKKCKRKSISTEFQMWVKGREGKGREEKEFKRIAAAVEKVFLWRE